MKRQTEDVQRVIDALQKHSFKVSTYSGRAMYGANCVGVDVESFGEIMKIAVALSVEGLDEDDIFELGDALRVDNMGLGYIVYWPALKLSTEQHATLQQLEDDEQETR